MPSAEKKERDWGRALPENRAWFFCFFKTGFFFLLGTINILKSTVVVDVQLPTAHLKVIKRVHFKWALADNPSIRGRMRQEDYEFKASLG